MDTKYVRSLQQCNLFVLYANMHAWIAIYAYMDVKCLISLQHKVRLFSLMIQELDTCDAISLALRTELRVTVDLLILSMSLWYSSDEYRCKLASFPGFSPVSVSCMDMLQELGRSVPTDKLLQFLLFSIQPTCYSRSYKSAPESRHNHPSGTQPGTMKYIVQ